MGSIKISNVNSHLTAKEREKPSFPTRFLLKNNFLKGAILDFGSGFGKDIEYLNQQGFNVTGYDPNYYPKYPNTKFDTIICNYVLNVLEPMEQSLVIMNISELLNKDGKAYFSVRRDIKYEGFRMHKIHKKLTFQCNVTLPFKSIFINDSCEIYEYEPVNQIVNKSQCPFCNVANETVLLTESATAYSILDKFPVNEGHALIIPKIHKSNFFELNGKEQQACLIVLNRTKTILQKRFSPDGFNVGINIGETAGQTVPHVHIHLIPRYNKDVEDPTGGIRNVIPGKGKY